MRRHWHQPCPVSPTGGGQGMGKKNKVANDLLLCLQTLPPGHCLCPGLLFLPAMAPKKSSGGGWFPKKLESFEEHSRTLIPLPQLQTWLSELELWPCFCTVCPESLGTSPGDLTQGRRLP